MPDIKKLINEADSSLDTNLSQDEMIDALIESEHGGLPGVSDPVMKSAIKNVINTTLAETMNESLDGSTLTGNVAQYTPVVISLIRRIMPTLVGPQIVGMQPLNMPTGRIFVQHVYTTNMKTDTKTEVWGEGTVGTDTAYGQAPDPAISGPYATATGEQLGYDAANPYNEMSFSIEGIDVGVKTRALKGRLTTEVIQDLKAVHGLEATSEITSILQTELTADIDREIIATIYKQAKVGAQNCHTKGTYDFSVDADGRWMMEKIMGLLIQIEHEATQIALETRRGRGNIIVTSPELAAYLAMANLITDNYKGVGFTPIINPVGVSYYGVLANRYKVFVDPYLTHTLTTPAEGETAKILHQIIVGYKGANQYDAGVIYCPYIPITMHSTVDPNGFGPIFGVKSRYGLISNPYYSQSASNNVAADGTNSYFRKFSVITQTSI